MSLSGEDRNDEPASAGYQLAPISELVHERPSSSIKSSISGINGRDSSVFAYCPQIPSILNGSVRSNILMGHELIPSRYEEVLVGCGLRQDMMVKTLSCTCYYSCSRYHLNHVSDYFDVVYSQVLGLSGICIRWDPEGAISVADRD